MLAYATGGNLDNIAVNQRVLRLAGESDADFRARVQLSPEAYSVAGPRLAYMFHAKSASPEVRDVNPVRTSPGGFTMAGFEQGILGAQGGPLAAILDTAKRLTAAGAGVLIGGAALAGELPRIDTRPAIAARARPVRRRNRPRNRATDPPARL